MTYKTLGKHRKKWKFIFILAFILLLLLMLLLINGNGRVVEDYTAGGYIVGGGSINDGRLPKRPTILKSIKENGIIVAEKYDAHKIKSRIAEEKIQRMKQEQTNNDIAAEEAPIVLDVVTTAIHIYYTAPVTWYKARKSSMPFKETLMDDGDVSLQTTREPVRVLNIAFYPERGLYKPTIKLLQQHFDSIRKCGVGVMILNFAKENNLYEQGLEQGILPQMLELAPKNNLSITFEISVALNQSVEYLREQLWEMRKYQKYGGFYKVHAISRSARIPVIYVSNAYKLSETLGRYLCSTHPDSLRKTLDAYFIGHIRLKNHAATMRRMCFDGFYSRLPSNGANFVTTWKNWAYLKSFAVTYKMIFVPTVGPGFAERNKFPRHGDIQRHRSNGRYYGVSWRTAILNHVGFINIASFNNWPDGSQIEEVKPKPGYLDYSPGPKTKYLDLTAHWVDNFIKSRKETLTGNSNCFELLNNTIC